MRSWVVRPSIAGCGRIILFLLVPVASLGRELWLTFWDSIEPLILARVTLLATFSLFVFGHLGVLIICFFFGLWTDRSRFSFGILVRWGTGFLSIIEPHLDMGFVNSCSDVHFLIAFDSLHFSSPLVSGRIF